MAKRKNNPHPSATEPGTDFDYEPFLPAERSLIFWSLGLGAALMILLAWVSYAYFPAG